MLAYLAIPVVQHIREALTARPTSSCIPAVAWARRVSTWSCHMVSDITKRLVALVFEALGFNWLVLNTVVCCPEVVLALQHAALRGHITGARDKSVHFGRVVWQEILWVGEYAVPLMLLYILHT